MLVGISCVEWRADLGDAGGDIQHDGRNKINVNHGLQLGFRSALQAPCPDATSVVNNNVEAAEQVNRLPDCCRTAFRGRNVGGDTPS